MKYQLHNSNGVHLTVTDFGCRIMEIFTPDRNGKFADIALGSLDEDKYINFGTGERFLGATVGRYGNRIAEGQFTIDGKTYNLARNNGTNSLHGGIKAFDMVTWEVVSYSQSRIEFRYLSHDGEEGFPGNLDVHMTYELTEDNELVIRYEATCDKATVCNLTHHSYFNLHGEGVGDINDHVMYINADRYTPVDANLIPTGELAPVEGTPLDFRTPQVIGLRSGSDFEQIRLGFGYDHNWVLNKKEEGELSLAATVVDPQSGRRLDVLTTEPGMQFYGGNYFDGSMTGKRGLPYVKNAGLALETQHFPDSPNHPAFPTTILRPGETYRHTCIYRFGVEQ